MAIILEILNKQQKVMERHRFSQPRISLGRAFDNDLILYDKHVSPHHAELVMDEQGRWLLRDLSSLNGSYLPRQHRMQQATEWPSGELCFLGEQAIRLYDEQHPVAAAQPFSQFEQRLQKFGHLGLISLLAVLLIAAELFSLWLETPDPSQGRWTRNLLNLPLLLLGLALWPALLALWSRINQHEARFLPQLGITFAAMVALELWQGSLSVLNFSLDGATAVVWLAQIGQTSLMILLLFANFYLALQLSTQKKLLFAVMAGLLINLQGVALNLLNDEQRQLQPHYDASLYPLAFYLNKPQSQAEFQQDNAQLFQQAGLARQNNEQP